MRGGSERLSFAMIMLFSEINSNNFKEEYTQLYKEMCDARHPVSKTLHQKLVETCQKNIWLRVNGAPFEDDPCLELDSPYEFCEFQDIDSLKLFFDHGNWSIRQGVLYKDLFFCNQVNGGDEWWTWCETFVTEKVTRSLKL